MRVAFLVILLYLGSYVGFSQDSTNSAGRKTYLMLGSSVPVSSGQSNIFSLVAMGEFNKQFAYSAGLYGRSFAATGTSEYFQRTDHRPSHDLREVNLSVGKIIGLSPITSVSFFVGPSLVRYDMPHNFRVTHSGGWKGYNRYEHDTRTYFLPGATARADLAILPIRQLRLSKSAVNGFDLGGSVGGLVNYNRKLTSWGLNLSLVFGVKETPKKAGKEE